MNNHGGMGPQRGGNDPVLGGHMHQLSSHSPTMGSPESKPVIQASMLAAYQGKILELHSILIASQSHHQINCY